MLQVIDTFSCSPVSKVCHLLLLAGDIELNPGPIPKECKASLKRTSKPKDRFMADVISNKTELLVNETVHTVYRCA